ncbi:hypothetical protein MRB53_041851 [Persea americana]|nr:hypothetical protein MRB53_041851 [Persea americana]
MAQTMGGSLIAPIGYEPHMQELRRPSKEVLERQWGLAARVDPSVTFEEYVHWAKIERAEEMEANRQYIEERGPTTMMTYIKGRFSKGIHYEQRKKADKMAKEMAIKEKELAKAGEGGRKNSMAETYTGMFDPSVAPTEADWKIAASFAFSTLGWAPGIVIYMIFGALAGFSGWILWQVFLGLDSSRFPMQSYGDTYFRVYGKWSRHAINVGQAIQQFMTVCVLILALGLSLAQLTDDHICFIVTMVVSSSIASSCSSR